MSHIFSAKKRAAKKQQEEAARQAALLRQQQQTASTAQRKPSLGAPNANIQHQTIGKRPSKSSLTNLNAVPQHEYPQQSKYGYPQQSQYVGYPMQQNMGPPPQGWGQPQQQWGPNGYGQQPGPNMTPAPQYYQPAPGQHPFPPQQGGAPWGPPGQQYSGPGYPGQGFPGQGYPPFQPQQPNPGSGRRASGGGLTGNGLKRASQQSLSKGACGAGQITVGMGSVVEQMQDCVAAKGLEPKFYHYESIVKRAKELFNPQRPTQTPAQVQAQLPPLPPVPQQIQSAWKLSDEEAAEMCILRLFDVWLLCDDSRSMRRGDREKDMKFYVDSIATAGTLFDHDGINLDFFHNPGAEGVKTEAEVTQIFSKKVNQSGTPMGLTLDTKILPKIRDQVSHGTLKKPVLILIITDGAPWNDGPRRDLLDKDAENYVHEVISKMVNFLVSHDYPAGTVNYMFAQVGNDLAAANSLDRLDNAPGIKEVVDATSSFELESTQVKNLTKTGYLLKLLLGAISPKRDASDNKRRGSGASSRSRR